MSGKWHGGKGSRPRPFSVSQDQFANSWDTIFGKKKKTDAEKFDESIMKNEYYEETMSPSTEQMKQGTCGCGRSPTGDCCGWHGLTEADYQKRKELYETSRVDLHGKDIN